MRTSLRKLFILGAVACLMPLAGLAEDAQAPAVPATPAETPAEEPAENGTAQTDRDLTGFSGKILSIGPKAIEVQRMGVSPNPKTPQRLRLEGGADVPVSGSGKSSWKALKKGDLVTIAYSKTKPPRVAKVLVLPASAHPLVDSSLRVKPGQRSRQRKFTGWIKKKDDDLLVVRTPDAMAPSRRMGETKDFLRHEGTVVEMGRDSWKTLQKGDRVTIEFSKGNPRPADRIVVVLRGGEKPLPPGLATRLFDPRYDRSIRDVDGIGEIRPGQPWKRAAPPPKPTSAATPTPVN